MIDHRNGHPRLFIGSSPEGKAVADAVCLNLRGEIAAEVWSRGLFGFADTATERHDRAALDFDFAALVVTAGDLAEPRNEAARTRRDEILFEAGLFLGQLGPERSFLLQPKDPALPLPSVLAELSAVSYREGVHPTLETAMAPAAARLRAAIRKFKEYRPVLRPSDASGAQDDQPLLARPRRRSSLGTASAQGPRHVMRIVDLSVTGALLASSGALPVGQLLDLELTLDDGTPIRVTARVVRVQYPNWGRVGGVGVAFTGIAPETREELERFVEGHEAA